MRQTQIQETEAIRKGSVRVLIGDDFESLVDIGALRNPVFSSLAENQSVVFDNVEDLKKFVKGNRAQLAFDLAEINLTNIAKLDAGLISITTVAGSIVNNHSQVVASGAWAYNTFIPFDNQNGDGSAITPDSVTGGTDGALVANTDYFVTSVDGVRGIIIADTADVTTLSQTITIVYDYTPNASKKITFNETGTKTLKCMRIINTDENNKDFIIDIENGTNMTPVSIDWAGDAEEDVAVLPIQFEGDVVEITDEQQVA